MSTIGAPAPRPCASCPYRTDVPSGIWDASEYEKLPTYDRPTMDQPIPVFLCHQHDRGSELSRVCAGWAGCHDGDELLSLRIARFRGDMTDEDVEATILYHSPVPLFPTGVAAAAHGIADIIQPGDAAVAAMRKIERRRNIQRDGGDVDKGLARLKQALGEVETDPSPVPRRRGNTIQEGERR